MIYSEKKALVCGMGRSGIYAARLLLAHGAQVTLSELAQNPVVDADLLADERVNTHFGANPDDIIDEHQLVVLSPGIATDLPFVEIARSRNIPILSEIELASRHCVAPIIAITGTNGKTTVCTLVGKIMSEAFAGSMLAGNIGIAFSSIAEKIDKSAWVVAEISSFQLETIIDFKPKISAVLNITPDHLNRHKTMENYISAKERIFENQDENDFCVLNYDNQYCNAMVAKMPAKVIFFSKMPLDEGVFIDDDWIRVVWNGIDERVVSLEDIGSHNVENIMAAVAICIAAGVPMVIISKEIRNFKAVEHRVEFVRDLRGVSYYNDSKATNVDSALNAINVISALGRPIVLIAGGQDKKLDFGDLVKVFPNRVKSVIVLGEVAEEIIHTCKAYNYHNYELVTTLKDAVELATTRAVFGDAVLLSPACASQDMFDNYEQRGRIFKDFVNELQ
ncbi:MAG: UDP-N-acetylmuramoyl-L-alanine--D-glutamate ligase [Defluviitaleaceae bacterium]|nr:UDP-N-acetylmuramoyl-L-alanine--D-glutamate ligase [Defluviitaleaceae bacterium]